MIAKRPRASLLVGVLGVAALGVAALGVAARGVATLGVAALGVAARAVAALGVAALGVAALGACSGDRALGTESLSGSRLKARYLTAESDARLIADWYDTELLVTCAPRLAADGRTRCLPTSPGSSASAAAAPGSPITAITPYADAACTRIVRAWGSPCEVPAYVTSARHDDCGVAGVAVFTVEGVATPETLYRVDEGTGQCVTLGEPSPELTYLYVGAEVAPSAFVELVAEDGAAGTGRIRRRFYRGDDGSRVPLGLWDRELDVACVPSADRDGALRCLPGEIDVSYFGDAGCTQPMAMVTQPDVSCEVAAPAYGRRTEMQECQIRARVFALGSPVADAVLYYDWASGVCEPYPVPPGSVGTRYGLPAEQELDPGAFVGVNEEIAPSGADGQGRVQVRYHRTGDGYSEAVGLYDRDLGAPCRPVATADGQTRCLPPVSGLARERFSDPACSLAIQVAWVQSAECLPDGEVRYVLAWDDGCPSRARIHTLGASLDGTPLYEQDGAGTCGPVTGAFFFFLGAELDVASFPAFTLEQAD